MSNRWRQRNHRCGSRIGLIGRRSGTTKEPHHRTVLLRGVTPGSSGRRPPAGGGQRAQIRRYVLVDDLRDAARTGIMRCVSGGVDSGGAPGLVRFIPRGEDPQEFFVGAPACGGCNAVTDHAWLPERFRVRNRHPSLNTYDGAVLVNLRFVELVGTSPGVVFDAVPGDAEYYRMLVDTVVVVDRTVGKYRVEGSECSVCGRISQYGWPVRFCGGWPPEAGFVRTDVEYGTVGATRICHQTPNILVNPGLASMLTSERLCRFRALDSE